MEYDIWKVINRESITVAQGWKCRKCGVIYVNNCPCGIEPKLEPQGKQK